MDKTYRKSKTDIISIVYKHTSYISMPNRRCNMVNSMA